MITIAVTVAILGFDVFIVARRPRVPSMKECALALSGYVGLAILFGAWIWIAHGHDYGIQLYAGWLTEYSLSIDNLFVFLIIMESFHIPRKYQQEALMVGIVLALVFRALFIAIGAVAISTISWIFYILGLFLLYTAYTLVRRYRAGEPEQKDNAIVSFAKRHFDVTDEIHGLKFFIRRNGKRLLTPMLLVIIALGTTDILFALDSIPAIFGLTREPYIVFTANVLALMGLRQLYFLLGGLVQRLVYLSLGLAVILAFIGVKLILHALHDNTLPFLNGGEPIHVFEIPTLVSLGVIVLTLLVTAVASLAKSRDGSSPPPAR